MDAQLGPVLVSAAHDGQGSAHPKEGRVGRADMDGTDPCGFGGIPSVAQGFGVASGRGGVVEPDHNDMPLALGFHISVADRPRLIQSDFGLHTDRQQSTRLRTHHP